MNREEGTCKGELVFSETAQTLLRSEICTTLNVSPIFAHSNGYFVYYFNNAIYYASPDFSITGDLTDYFDSFNWNLMNLNFKSVGETIVLLTKTINPKFIVFNDTFQIISERSIEIIEEGNSLLYQSKNWLFYNNGFDYFENDNSIIFVNFETFENGFVDLGEVYSPIQGLSGYKYLVFDGELYQISSKIRVLNADNTFLTLEDNVYSLNSNVKSILKNGYIDYIQAQGLTQINKSINLQTKEVYLESESKPQVTVTQVQPIN
jgi:hypothetical protein